jgi:hypothetical protein
MYRDNGGLPEQLDDHGSVHFVNQKGKGSNSGAGCLP